MQHLAISLSSESSLERHFAGIHSGGGRSSIPGGQTAADEALQKLDISGYANNRSEVLPISNRGAGVLSPYIRHNLLILKQVWKHVGKSNFSDREKFRDELKWQEYARHLYTSIGTRLFHNLRFEQVWNTPGNGWLHGQERMYRELIDGSRAANLLGWQWTVGAGTGKAYGFAQWQVQKRAPQLCASCPVKMKCPIKEFPQEMELEKTQLDSWLLADPALVANEN